MILLSALRMIVTHDEGRVDLREEVLYVSLGVCQQ